MVCYDDTYCNAHGMEDVVKYTFCASCIDGLNHDRLSGFVESNDLPICVSGYVIICSCKKFELSASRMCEFAKFAC
jgi:hypothetical protein